MRLQPVDHLVDVQPVRFDPEGIVGRDERAYITRLIPFIPDLQFFQNARRSRRTSLQAEFGHPTGCPRFEPGMKIELARRIGKNHAALIPALAYHVASLGDLTLPANERCSNMRDHCYPACRIRNRGLPDEFRDVLLIQKHPFVGHFEECATQQLNDPGGIADGDVCPSDGQRHRPVHGTGI